MITRRQVVEHFGSIALVAEHFHISPAAVYLWPDDGPIPRKRELELLLEFPKEFRNGADRTRAA